MKPLLTIGITSYNRVKELTRCIKSIQTKYVDDIEILISEDKSPLSDKIKERAEKLAAKSEYNIRFTSNEENLGYDMNLGAIIKKSLGDFIFFMSDDDIVSRNCLDDIIDFLREAHNIGVIYSPFRYAGSRRKDRVRGGNHFIPAGEKSVKSLIYDSILFSGLIFKKSYVEEYDSSRFKNMNYFQVYLFMQMLLHYGGYYLAKTSVICVGDGENAYGISKSSGGNKILANRKSVKSNLEFNKTLIKVIRLFDEDEQTDVIDSFSKQYSLHAYSGLSIARTEGVKYYNEYWKILRKLDIDFSGVIYFYYIILLIFGKKISDFMLSGFRRVLKREK